VLRGKVIYQDGRKARHCGGQKSAPLGEGLDFDRHFTWTPLSKVFLTCARV
jgi:hypothetical protein